MRTKAQMAAAMKNVVKARKKAHTPEARAKAAATIKRRNAARKEAEAQGVPLDMIPDRPKIGRPKGKKKVKNSNTRQEVVLALLKYLNEES